MEGVCNRFDRTEAKDTRMKWIGWALIFLGLWGGAFLINHTTGVYVFAAATTGALVMAIGIEFVAEGSNT